MGEGKRLGKSAFKSIREPRRRRKGFMCVWVSELNPGVYYPGISANPTGSSSERTGLPIRLTFPFFPRSLVLSKNEYIKLKRVHSGFSIINMFLFIYFSCIFLSQAVFLFLFFLFLFALSYSPVDTPRIQPCPLLSHSPTPTPTHPPRERFLCSLCVPQHRHSQT